MAILVNCGLAQHRKKGCPKIALRTALLFILLALLLHSDEIDIGQAICHLYDSRREAVAFVRDSNNVALAACDIVESIKAERAGRNVFS